MSESESLKESFILLKKIQFVKLIRPSSAKDLGLAADFDAAPKKLRKHPEHEDA